MKKIKIKKKFFGIWFTLKDKVWTMDWKRHKRNEIKDN